MKRIKSLKILCTVILAYCFTSTNAQNAFNVPVEYIISAEFFPQDASLHGYKVSPESFMRASTIVNLHTPPENTIVFYLHGELGVDSIKADSKKLSYSGEKVFYSYDYSNVALKVTVDTSFHSNQLCVYYSGFFNPSRSRSPSDFMRINIQEGVFLRSYGYSLWFPVFIEPNNEINEINVKRVIIKTPSNFRTIVAGKQINEISEGLSTVSTWEPGLVNPDDVQCVSSDYNVLSHKNVFVYSFRDSVSEQSSVKILDYVLQLKDLYETNIRKINNSNPVYIVEMPRYGDISGNNIIGIQQSRFMDFNNIWTKLTIAHELAHPYVQLPVSSTNSLYALVIEGFPGFFQVYAVTRIIGNPEFNTRKIMKEIQSGYLKKRETGVNRRGNKLPVAKPITQITADEIGNYKDNFILNDRVWLFFYHIWNKMGDDTFDRFLKTLFINDSMDYQRFEKVILQYLPGFREDLNIWLNTQDFPERFYIE